MSSEPIRSLTFPSRSLDGTGPDASREWLVTNGLGGYASGTVPGTPTRRYHGLLVAALPAPLGRVLVLNHLQERYESADGASVVFGAMEKLGQPRITPEVGEFLSEFRLESGLPVWRFSVGDSTLERRVVLAHRRNVAHLLFRVVEGASPIRVSLRPFWNVRPHDAPVSTSLDEAIRNWKVEGTRIEYPASRSQPAVRLHLSDSDAHVETEPEVERDIFYRVEAERGYAETGDLHSFGVLNFEIRPGRTSALSVSVEPWDQFLDTTPERALEQEIERRRHLIQKADPRARQGVAAELVMAADSFLIEPIAREASDPSKHRRSVIAGYPWFTDWGRDTMISLPGLTLSTGRLDDGLQILRSFASVLKDGLIPNLFPEGQSQGLYHTADATLWFFHAIDAYTRASGNQAFLEEMLPHLLDIIEHHRAGTRFGIAVDPLDGLLRQGAPGYQLTWMDAKVGDWVVTPRRGKAVEINALWYHALTLIRGWVRDLRTEDQAQPFAHLADQARDSFNQRFWNPASQALFDVVEGEEGDDPSMRPNQILAVSLPNAVLDSSRWLAVVSACDRLLFSPVGLRSLSPESERYHPHYIGDLTARDSAYHNGTVWAWLMGPYLDAWRKVYPGETFGARERLLGLLPHLDEACVGSISEIFDAEPPFTPRGCVAQAWSVAEVLRCWVETEPAPASSS